MQYARTSGLVICCLLCAATSSRGAELETYRGWTRFSPREELSPKFSIDPHGGPAGKGSLVIESDAREGLEGRWVKTFPVVGGDWYRFACARRLEHVALPRRSAIVRIEWSDDAGRKVPRDEPARAGYMAGTVGQAQPDYPIERGSISEGWTEVSGVFHAPKKATRATVELQSRWAVAAKVEYADVALAPTSPPAGRKVRLAAVHFRPSGKKTPAENCRLFEPLIEEAARQKADLVVLPETLTQYGTGLSYAAAAEPMPGPSSEYFGQLARKHNLYIVAGLCERDGSLIYNVAVLLGPDGKIAGKYRKVTLPRGENETGVYPGHEYPVFQTRFGKLGMMVCFDGFFPEVARELSNRGAEVIAWPVAGCNPLLARARACENQVFIVSSTYTDSSTNWMQTAVYNPYGETAAVAKEWNTVILAEVDLDQTTYWNSIGDFRSEMTQNRPVSSGERSGGP
jgi:predicted amidohydrolase